MKCLCFILLGFITTNSFAINIRIQNLDTKEVKSYSTQKTFKIPVETSTQKCFLTKDGKDLWGYSCTSRIEKKDYVPSHKTVIDCGGSNSSLNTLLMEVSPDGKGTKTISKFDIIISCTEIQIAT